MAGSSPAMELGGGRSWVIKQINDAHEKYV